MAKNENASSKKRIILIVVFICLIVLATICVLLLSPLAKRLMGFGKNDAPIKTTATEFISETDFITGALEPSTEAATSDAHTSETVPPVSIPAPTEADIDTDKNYTFFIDESTFDYTYEDGATTLKAKDNKDVIITVTPYKAISYSALCSQTAKIHEKDSEQPKLRINNLYAVYHSDQNGTETTVYCIDDGIGGSIKLKYERPSDAKEYDTDFEILVSMFKLK